MRTDYPVSSMEFNDRMLMAYENLTYLLGYEDDSNRYSGLYENLEESGLAYMGNQSGIPHVGNIDTKYRIGLDEGTSSEQIITYLKFDYLYRKKLDMIRKVI